MAGTIDFTFAYRVYADVKNERQHVSGELDSFADAVLIAANVSKLPGVEMTEVDEIVTKAPYDEILFRHNVVSRYVNGNPARSLTI